MIFMAQEVRHNVIECQLSIYSCWVKLLGCSCWWNVYIHCHANWLLLCKLPNYLHPPWSYRILVILSCNIFVIFVKHFLASGWVFNNLWINMLHNCLLHHDWLNTLNYVHTTPRSITLQTTNIYWTNKKHEIWHGTYNLVELRSWLRHSWCLLTLYGI